MKTRTATLATIPGREEEVRQCINSLCPQFDLVNVVFNYADKPLPPPPYLSAEISSHDNLYLSVGDNTWGDAAKFAFSAATDGYQFFCDDDLIYPPDYADVMISKIEEHGRKAAVSLAGSYIRGKMRSYYRERVTIGHCLKPYPKQDTWVNVLGTGVLAFHSDLLRVPLDNETFPASNMADVHFAVLGQRRKIPMLCMAHFGDWLTYPESMRGKWTIFDCQSEHDATQAEYCNRVGDWSVYCVG
jgi:hypothetical protein